MRLALAIALASAVTWLYTDVGRGLVVQWVTSPDASYGVILAAVGGALIWQRRDILQRSTPTPAASATGTALILAGLGLLLAGQVAADVFTTRASLVVLLAGLVCFLSGTQALQSLATPLGFLLLAIPLPELMVTTLTGSLQTVAALTAEKLLTTVGIPVYRDGNVLDLPTSTLQVVEACSGLRSVISLASVGLLLAWSGAGGLPRRLGLVVAAVPIAVLVNGIRLAATGAASERWGSVATRDPWHSLAGWLTFIVSLLVLLSVRRALAPLSPTGERGEVAHA